MPSRRLASLTIELFLAVTSLGYAQSDKCALADGVVPDNPVEVAD
jgi:hypothetical protein